MIILDRKKTKKNCIETGTINKQLVHQIFYSKFTNDFPKSFVLNKRKRKIKICLEAEAINE